MKNGDTRLTLSDVSGPLKDLNEKLSGASGAYWLAGLKMFLRKENPWPTTAFTVWGEIDNLPWGSSEEFLRYVTEENLMFYINVIMATYEIEADVINLLKGRFINFYEGELSWKRDRLVVLSIHEMGFRNNFVDYEEICERAEWIGLKLCRQHTAFSILLEGKGKYFKDICVASEPIYDSPDHGKKFILLGQDHDHKRLSGILRRLEIPSKKHRWPDNLKFIFCWPEAPLVEY